MMNKKAPKWNKDTIEKARQERDEEIRKLIEQERERGTLNYQKIADMYGLTRERIRQIAEGS